MKKKLSFILIINLFAVLLMSNMVFADNVKGYKKVINGKILSLGKKNFDGQLGEANLFIKDMELEGTQLSINGTIEYGEKKYPLHIKEELKFSELKKGGLVSNGIKGNNFDIIHLSIGSFEEPEMYLTDNGKNNHSEKIMKLYLMKKGTREFFAFEFSDEAFEKNNELNILVKNEDNKEKFELDYWQHIVFEPVNIEQEVYKLEVDKENLNTITEMGIDTAELGADRAIDYINRAVKEFHYTETYNAGAMADGYLTYHIKGRVKTHATQSIAGATLWITDKYTTSNYALYESDTSPFGVSHYNNPAKMQIKASGKNHFVNMSMDDTNAEKKSYWWAPEVYLGFDLQKLGLPISFSWAFDADDLIEYESGKTYSLEPYTVEAPNPEDSKYIPHIAIKWNNMLLADENDTFYLKGDYKDNTSGNNYFYSRFEFVISAKYDASFSYKDASDPTKIKFEIETYDYYSN